METTPKGDDPKGDDPKGDDPKGDVPTGGDPKGDDPIGDDPRRVLTARRGERHCSVLRVCGVSLRGPALQQEAAEETEKKFGCSKYAATPPGCCCSSP